MAALSDSDILSCIKAGELCIEPFAEPSLSSAGYDLRCGSATAIPPGEHALIHTVETVRLGPSLCGQMFIRSSFAREGAIGSFALVDPGFRGQLTLCIINMGAKPLVINGGERIAQIVFHRLVTPSSKPYSGRYQGSVGTVESQR